MADITKINNGSATYNIKDAAAARDSEVVKLNGTTQQNINRSTAFVNNSIKHISNYNDRNPPATYTTNDVLRCVDSLSMSTLTIREIFSPLYSGQQLATTEADIMFSKNISSDNTPLIHNQRIIFRTTKTGNTTSDKVLEYQGDRIIGSAFAACGMASSSYVSGIFGSPIVSNSNYTATVNGWVIAQGTGTVGSYIMLINSSRIVRDVIPTNSGTAYVMIPVSKNDVVRLNFSEGITITIAGIYKSKAEVL